jgi:hypothetical protein
LIWIRSLGQLGVEIIFTTLAISLHAGRDPAAERKRQKEQHSTGIFKDVVEKYFTHPDRINGKGTPKMRVIAQEGRI